VKQPPLFPLPDPEESLTMPTPPLEQQPRLVRPNRQQVEWRPVALDALLAEDHPARAAWAYAEQVDIGPLHAEVGSVVGRAGRPASDRRVLFALWLYATLDGVGSARRVARLCEEHLAYMWLCGGVPVDYHLLADFRTEHAEWLDGLLTESMATLMDQGVMTLERVTQDGLRVRASAGASSFRRGERLAACLREAEEQVATAECVNANARNHGLYQFLVRGLANVRAIALWHALAHNVRRILRLCPAAIGLG